MFDFFLTFFLLFMVYFLYGDIMNKSFVVPFIICIVLGVISAQIVYSRYKVNLEASLINAYFIKVNSSFDEELSNDDFKYLVLEEENSFNVYVGITTDLFNANKIKSIYEEKDFDVSIVPVIVDNVEFISNLEQYDILISEVDNDNNIISINDVILSSYEEMVLGK